VRETSVPPTRTRRWRRSNFQAAQLLWLLARPGGLGATDHRADAGHQLAEPERLDHVVVGAQLQADDPVDLLGAGGDDDDRHRRAGPQPPAHVQAVYVRQPQIEQDDVVWRRCQRLGTGPCPADLEAVAGEPGGQRLGDRVVVFNQQHAHAHRMTPGFGLRRDFARSWAPPNRALACAFPAIPYREPMPAVLDTRCSIRGGAA
jgi:hypothetical protein